MTIVQNLIANEYWHRKLENETRTVCWEEWLNGRVCCESVTLSLMSYGLPASSSQSTDMKPSRPIQFLTNVLFFALSFIVWTVAGDRCRLSSLKRPLWSGEFQSRACGECLFYIYFVAPIGSYAINYRFLPCAAGLLICPVEKASSAWCSCDNPVAVFNVPEYALSNGSSTSIELLSVHPPLPTDFIYFTRQCCREAAKCCRKVLSADARTLPEGSSLAAGTCPATWDGWQCFERSEPREVRAKCPHYIYGDKILIDQQVHNYAVKLCRPQGEWFIVNETQNEWTNYSKCMVRRSYMVKFVIGVLSFAITVVAIIPAIIIMCSYRILKTQEMFILHRNLLLSFLLCGAFFIFNSFFFVVDGSPGERLYLSNHISCRILFTIHLRYLRLTTYTWMLSEGWYLHRLLIAAFAEPKSLLPYYIVCWGFPIVPTVVYSVLRMVLDDADCWVAPSQLLWIDWIITGPCLFALCANLVLMVLILWVLIRKLRFTPDLEPAQYRKAVRGTLMLLPVFGLHFLLTIYRIPSFAHQIFNLMLDGLQGFFVALIVCYTNHTVVECLKKTWETKKDQRQLDKQSMANKIKFRKSIDIGRPTPNGQTDMIMVSASPAPDDIRPDTNNLLSVPPTASI